MGHNMRAVIVSDLHLGSRHFLHREFEQLLNHIPEHYDIILNGDVLDNPNKNMPLSHQRLLDIIKQRSLRQTVIWVRGNHDNGYIPENFGNVQFKPIHSLPKLLFIAHGDNFDEVMPRSRIFMRFFNALHKLRVKLGASPVHVANYAKRWKYFYGILRKNVVKNAVQSARQNGFGAVTCGHTHYPEDVLYDGIRYINTGAWTESPSYFLLITDNQMALHRFDDYHNLAQPFQENGDGTGLMDSASIDR